MCKISVLTPSNRDIEGLEIVSEALMRQTFTDFEWIIGSPERPEDGSLMDFVWVQDPPKDDGDYWVLNKLYNKMILASQGDLLLSIQDFTSFDPDALSKFWFHFESNPLAVVGGVGNKYEDLGFDVRIWQDPRERDDLGTFYETTFDNIEFNFASCPREAFYSVGGFDEYLDRYAGMDAFGVLDRLEMLSEYKFYLDQTNKSYSLEHGRYDQWEERNAIHGPYHKRRATYLENPVLPYLVEDR